MVLMLHPALNWVFIYGFGESHPPTFGSHSAPPPFCPLHCLSFLTLLVLCTCGAVAVLHAVDGVHFQIQLKVLMWVCYFHP